MRKQPKLVLLAKDQDEKASAVIDALCRERSIPVILIDSRIELGKIAGLVSRHDKSKVCPCGVAAVLDYGKNSEGKVFVMNVLRDMLSKTPADPEEQRILASTLSESIEESIRSGKLLSESGIPRLMPSRKQGKDE
ncbi:UNVERIFIED_CONTAM: hypothetical protein PYX00_011808 [Menopon gallinae]|uniref:Ribosomal protein eL8/eL30/eS12/Gadd45 domain-containing protein n=1 Tax=Menopon gallinae TaxID=328185 RepID=A0AAW2H8R9_9NEOP